MSVRVCTCAGTAPGYPMHESSCGRPDYDVCPSCGAEAGSDPGCPSCVREANRNEDDQ